MQWLKDFLPLNMLYYPVDYIVRSEDTLIYDFNKYEFPTIYADFSFVSGGIEYINDYEWFIEKISQYTTTAIISYLPVSSFGLSARRKYLFMNCLEKEEIISLFEKHSMELTVSKRYKSTDIFKFVKH